MLYVIDAYKGGGGERFLSRLILYNLEKGGPFEEWICTLREPGYFVHLKEKGVNVVNLCEAIGPQYGYNIPKWREDLAGLRLLPYVIKLVQLIRKEKFQIIVAIGYPANLMVALASVVESRPIYLERRAYVRSTIFLPLERMLMKWILGRFRRIICVSQAVKDSLIVPFPFIDSKTIVIHNGVDLTFGKEHINARECLGLGASDTIFVNTSRFVAGKGHQWLVKAFHYVVNKDPSTFLLLIGEGPLQALIEEDIRKKQLEGRVRFLGYVQEPLDWLHSCDVFVLSSEEEGEGFSNSLLEAMAVGLPVIAFDISFNREVVEPNVTGLLVPAGNVEGLANAMLTLARDPALRKRLGNNAARRVRENFSMEVVRERYNNLYREILEK